MQDISAEIRRICAFLGADFPEDAPADTAEELLGAAGLLFRPVELEQDWWRSAGGVLLCTDTDGAVHALLSRGAGYVFTDADGRGVRVCRKNAGVFRSDALRIYRALPRRSLTVRDFRSFLLHTVRRGDVLCLLLISLAAGAAGALIPEITRFMFSSLAPSGDMRNLFALALLFAGMLAASELFALSRAVSVARFGSEAELLVKNAVWDRLLSLPASFFRSCDAGTVTHMTEAADILCETLSSRLIPAVLGAFFSVLYLAEMGRLVPALFLPSLTVVLLLLGVQLAAARTDNRCERQNHAVRSRMQGMLFELLQGRAKLRTAGAEDRGFERWAALFGRLSLRSTDAELFVKALSGVILLGGTVWFYAIAGRRQLSASDFIASQSAFGLFCAAALQLADVSTQLAALRPAVDALRPVLEAEPETASRKRRAGRLSGELQLKDVGFRYTPSGGQILNGLNLHVRPGEYLGIAGATGSGKSTILRLILGLEQPESGAVLFDGADFAELEPKSVRSQIGTVLQEGRLFPGDILSNIMVGAPGITPEEVWEAAERSGFADDIRKMPLGMNTILTENGGGLSGGQQQRLLLTRALARRPRILLLDEATSALDNRSQSEVVRTLDSLGITRIVVAHRLSTLRACSRIIYLDRGRILEEGSFQELMELDGMFAAQAKRQLLSPGPGQTGPDAAAF